MKTFVSFMAMLLVSVPAFAADEILLSSIGVNVQTSCSGSSCKTIQCFNSDFKNCTKEEKKTAISCKKNQMKPLSMRVDTELQTISVCKDFNPKIRPRDQAFLRVEEFYQPRFKAMGKTLIVRKIPGSERPHAKIEGTKNYIQLSPWAMNTTVHHPLEVEIAIQVACHEVGHFIGGTPQFELHGEYYSAEGQAEQFAFSECLQSIFTPEENAAFVKRYEINEKIKKKCAEAKSTDKEYNQCLHLGTIALEGAQNLHPGVGIDTPDTNVVDYTYDTVGNYPSSQCILDNALHNILNFPNPSGMELRLPCWFKD